MRYAHAHSECEPPPCHGTCLTAWRRRTGWGGKGERCRWRASHRHPDSVPSVAAFWLVLWPVVPPALHTHPAGRHSTRACALSEPARSLSYPLPAAPHIPAARIVLLAVLWRAAV